MKWRGWLLGAILPATSVLAAGPQPNDFARGLELVPASGQPVQSLRVPDTVYAGVTRADLGDLRVFNADGVAVPQALCAPAPVRTRSVERELPVFRLGTGGSNGERGQRVVVETADGTRLRILEPITANEWQSKAKEAGYIFDARGLEGRLHGLKLNWRKDSPLAEFDVRIQASTNLHDWRTIVPETTLLRARGDNGTLERNELALPEDQYAYLRMERVDGDALPTIEHARAQLHQPAPASQPVTIETRLVERDSAAGEDADATAFVYDSGHLAPVRQARVRLPIENMSLAIALDSRSGAGGDWATRWRGEIHSLAGMQGTAKWSSIQSAPTSDRHWRVRVLRGMNTLADRALELDLRYRPQQLRFLAQGEGPFLLAFGSARAAPAKQRCHQLLDSVSDAQLRRLTGTPEIKPDTVVLAGEAVLASAPDPIPVRRYLLWALLIAGAAGLIGLGLNLLWRLRQ